MVGRRKVIILSSGVVGNPTPPLLLTIPQFSLHPFKPLSFPLIFLSYPSFFPQIRSEILSDVKVSLHPDLKVETYTDPSYLVIGG